MVLQENNNTGFTLIELVAVIVLLSILSVVAISRLGNLDTFESRAFFDEVVSAVRYAQKLAISSGCSVQVMLTPTGYSLHQRQDSCTSGDFTRDVLNPADRSSPYQNSSLEMAINPAAQFVFSARFSVASGLANDQTFNVNGRSFTVYPDTGLVDAP